MTLQDLFFSFFHPKEYMDFMPKYCSLLLEPIPDRGEKEFIEAIVTDADRKSFEVESATREVSQLTRLVFRVFNLIVNNSSPTIDDSDLSTLQEALHEYMFRTFHHIDVNCRKLLEARIIGNRHGDVEKYLEHLQRKYSLSKENVILVGQKWFGHEEATYQALIGREYRLKVYGCDSNTVCFQIYNDNPDPILESPVETRTQPLVPD